MSGSLPSRFLIGKRRGTRRRLTAALVAGTLCFASGGGADTYQSWKTRVFSEAEQADLAVSGETALSPAGDGIPNLLKYALNIDPHSNGSLLLPAISLVTAIDPNTGAVRSYPAIRYQTSHANPPTDLYYVPEISGDLQNWVRGDAYFAAPNVSAGGSDPDSDIATTLALSSTGAAFLRLRVIEGQTLPDDWQQLHFGYTGVDPSDDPDGDGKSNFDEFLHGTDPNDYWEGRIPTLEIVSGDGQRGPVSAFLSEALVVKVSYGGNALTNAPVRFAVVVGDGSLTEFFDASASQAVLDVRTGPNGRATVHASVGVTPAQAMSGRATAGLANPVTFNATAYLGFTRYVAAGGQTSFTGNGTGAIWAWGTNWVGQLADGTTTERDQPEQSANLDRIVTVAAADDHLLALKEDGTVWASGANWNGQLGDGTYEERHEPVQVSGLANIAKIAATDSGSMALKDDGTVWAWGTGLSSVLGNGSTDDALVPVQVMLENGQPLANVIAIAAGSGHRLAITFDGRIWTWGANWSGQLGDGTTEDRTYPVVIWAPVQSGNANAQVSKSGRRAINTLSAITATDVKAGLYHSLALLSDGTMLAWGANWDGGLGTGDFDDRWSPTPVLIDQATAIAAGDFFSLAIRGDGAAWAWGDNSGGQLGRDRYTMPWESPLPISGLSDVISIAGGGGHTIALGNAGRLWAVGANGEGQLGNVAAETVGTPVEPAIDLDGNGLLDSWERDHFGSAGHDAKSDDDGDGLTNAQEFALGTDPNKWDSDDDGVPDSQDGWPLNPVVSVAPLPTFRYAAIDISKTRIWGTNNSPDGVIEYPVDRDDRGFFPAVYTLPNGNYCRPTGYNDAGQILGSIATPRGVFHAGIIPDKEIFVLGDTDELYSAASAPLDINNEGKVLLNAHLDAPDQVGENLIVWKDDSILQLLPRLVWGRLNNNGDLLLGDTVVTAEGVIHLPFQAGGITDRDSDGKFTAVGDGGYHHRDAIWRDGVSDFIPTAGREYSAFYAWNNRFQAIGEAWNDGLRSDSWAPFWQNGRAFTIEADLLGAHLGEYRFFIPAPFRINERGMFVASDNRFLPMRSYLLMPVDLVVDGNRDGQMSITDRWTHDDDITTSDRPYRFWVNDDDDTEVVLNAGGTGFDPSESETVPPLHPDASRHQIVSKRNLEDFTRLWIYIPGLYDEIQQGEIRVALRWKSIASGNPAINIYSSADGDGSDSYLKDDAAATAQISGDFNNAVRFRSELQTIFGGGTFIFKTEDWADLSSDNPKKCFILEGFSEGKGELEVVFLDSHNVEIGSGGSLWLDLKDIKKMYQRIDAAPEHRWIPVHFEPDPREDKDNLVVFVHGWRMSPDGAGNYAETMFKRFWHRGFHGRFAAYHWDTDWFEAGSNWLPYGGQTVDAFLSHYNDSEHTAWNSAGLLVNYVNNAHFSNNAVIAHSMGNVVVGEALREGMHVDNYAMLQAAVPASCYDEDEIRIRQTVPYDQNAGLLHFTMWDSPTPDGDTDGKTRRMAYRGALKSIGNSTNVINFYLANDFATSFAWEINNDQTKPPLRLGDGTGNTNAPLDTAFEYNPVASSGHKLWKFTLSSLIVSYYLTDETEARPYACRSWGKAVGAWGQTRGVITNNRAISLSSGAFDFRDDHNAEFKKSIVELTDFTNALLDELGIEHRP